MTQSALNQLKQFTTIVADSSDLAAIEKFRPLNASWAAPSNSSR
jgi:transaldolase